MELSILEICLEFGTTEEQTRNEMRMSGGLIQSWDMKRQEREEVQAMKQYVPIIKRRAGEFWGSRLEFRLWKEAPICDGCGMI
jgi:hypothetical protein